MFLHTMFSRLRVAAVATAAAIALGIAAQPATAQNYDAAFQARVGAMLQGAAVRGDFRGADGVTGNFDFGSSGLGATAGFELVNKAGWSWGVEMDGVYMQGNAGAGGRNFGVDYLATLRLRAGRHMRPDLFWYGTGGLAAIGVEARLAGFNQGVAGLVKTSDTNRGYVIGTGLEWDFGPGLLFGEYLFGDFGSFTANGTNITKFDQHLHAVRFGVKFKVGHDHYHYDDDVARRIGRPVK